MKQFRTLLAFLFFSCLVPMMGWGQTATITITNSSIGGSSVLGSNNYGSGAERTWTQNTVSFGGKAITCNPTGTPTSSAACDYIQAQASNGVIYNTTALPGRLVSVQFTGSASVASSCYGGTSRLVNTTAADYTVGGTQIGTAQTNTTYTWTTAVSDNYTFFCIKRGSSAQYFSSIVITYETGTNYWWNGGNVSNNTNNIWDLNTTKNWGTTSSATFSANAAPGVVWPSSGSYIANFSNTVAGAKTINMPAAISVMPNSTIIGATGYSFVPSTTQTFSSPVTLTNSLTVAPASSTTFTMSGVVSSTGGLTQNGAGTTTLSGTNTYSGGTTISAGTISVAADNNLGTGNITMTGGATLAATTGFTTTKNFTLTNSNTLNVASGQILTLGNTATTGQLNGGSTAVITLSGAGTVSLGANNQTYYSGRYILNNGTLTTGSTGYFSAQPTSLVSGFPFTINGGTLDYTGFTTDNANYSYLLGNNASGGISMTSGTMAILGVCSDLSTGGILNKLGAGTVALSGANTYTGATNVNAGTLQLSANSTLPSTTDVTVATGTTLNVNGKTQTIGSLTGAGAVTLGAGALTVSGTNSTTYSGVMSGTGSLTKSGTNALTLSGTNTYTGTTTIGGGTLFVNGSIASGSAVTVSSGTLAGSGTVNGTVALTGTVSPGATASSIGTLTTGNITFNTGSSINIDLTNVTGSAGTNWDKLATGTITFNSSPTITINLAFNGSTGFNDGNNYTWPIVVGSGFTGSANYTVVPSGITYTGTFSVTQTSGTTINIVYTSNNNITLSPTTQALGPFCNSGANSVSLTYTKSGTVTAPFLQLSNSSGVFTSTSSAVGNIGNSVSGSGTFTITGSIPSGTTAGTYKLRVVSTDATPIVSADNNSTIVIDNPISITTPPTTPSTACATFSSSITGLAVTGSNPTYNWQSSANGTSGWNTVATNDANTGVSYTNGAASLAISGLTTTYYYRCVISNTGCGSTTTSPATTVTVTPTPSQASSLSTNTPTTDGFSASWTAGGGTGTMLVVRATANSNTLPSSGSSYTPNLAWASAGQIDVNNRVVFRAAGTSAGPVTGLTPETQYTITSYSYDATGNCYNTSSPVSTTQYTLSTEPGAHPASFSANTCSNTSITLNFTAASSITNCDGYIILRRQDGVNPTITGITDGVAPGSLSLPSGTTLVTTIASTSTTSYSDAVSAGVSYNYLIIPYNSNVSLTAQTYNYLASGSPLTTSATAGNASTASDIIADPTFTYNSDILYASYQGNPISNTSNSVGVFGLRLRDGGGTSDADALPTTLTGITFTVNSIAQTSVRRYALFQGNSFITEIANPGTTTVAFSGLSISAADNSTADFTLRVSFNNTAATITDNTQMTFSVASATSVSGCATVSSQFTSFTTVSSSTTGTRNQIEVVATKLAFNQGPTSTSNGATMTPSVTVTGQDANSVQDLDFNAAVTLVCSTPAALTAGAGPVTASGGTATFGGVVHGTDGTYTMTATASGYTATPTSSSYVISSIAANSYRTTGDGTWTSSGGTATWERFVSNSWTTSSAPSYSTSNFVYIRNTVSITGSASPANIIITSTGYLTNTASSTIGTSLLVQTGGTLEVDASLTVSGSFTVQDNAAVILNFAFSNPSTSIWAGTENFAPNSNLYIWDWKVTSSSNQPLINANVSTNTYNSYTAAFGNVYIDLAGGTVADHWEMLGNSYGTTNLCHGNLQIISPNGYDIRFVATAGVSATIGIQGNLKLSSGWSSARTVILGTSTANVTLNLKGNLELDCPGDFTLRASNSSGGGVTLNIDGNIIMNGSNTTSNTNFKLNQNSYSTANGSLSIVNLKGNLTVGTNPTIINLGAIADQQFNFTGTSTQLVNVASAIGTGGTAGVPMFIKNNAKVQLSTNNLVLNNSSTMTVEDGGLLDFGFNGSAPLIISNGGTGTNTFSSAQGSTLKITHQNGIVKNTANDGNVQLSISNKAFNQTATFWYIGKAIQTTGDAITTGSTGKIVIAELANNSLTLTPSNNIAISNGTTLDALGGRLDIRKGIVVETPSATITGSGRLVMTDGVFQSSVLSTTLPQLSNYSKYSLTGGTVELNGNGAQTISGAPSGGYYKVAITNAGTKSVTSAFDISKNLTITNGVFDPTNNAITGNAGLTMSGGTFRMSKLNVALPQLDGIDSVYNLTGGTVELYGSAATETHSLKGTYGNSSTAITYYNVELNASGANVAAGKANVVAQAGFNIGSGGVMNVNSPTCFQLASTFTIGGSGTFNITAGSTFKYGGTITPTGTITSPGNVETTTRNFPNTASYGFVGNTSSQDPGSGLPNKMVNMYLDKTNAGNLVTITQDEEVTNTLAFYTGIVKTNANTLYVSNTSTTAITGGNTSGTDKYVQGRLKRKTDGSSTYTFPIGHSSQNAQGFTITPTGTNGSDLLGYLEANSTTPVKSVAYCDLETKTAAGQQIGQGTAGPDGALDQVVFNLASPLQWDITNPGGGVSSYNVTVLGNGGQDISPVTSAGGTAIRYLLKNGEPGNTGFATGSGGSDYPTVGFIACPNQYTLTGMTSFSKFTLNGANPSGTGLPVKMLFFTGKKVENYSQLDWATAIEIDNDKFVVERSADAVRFEAIGSVKGAGNTTVRQDYQWLDKSPLTGWNYYRLKQVDFDGDIEYTNTVAVNFNGDETTPSIIVFPSPSKDFINVQVLGTNQIVEAVLYNMIGQAVKNVTPNERMSIEDLPSGEYFIKVIMGNNVVVKQFIKE